MAAVSHRERLLPDAAAGGRRADPQASASLQCRCCRNVSAVARVTPDAAMGRSFVWLSTVLFLQLKRGMQCHGGTGRTTLLFQVPFSGASSVLRLVEGFPESSLSLRVVAQTGRVRSNGASHTRRSSALLALLFSQHMGRQLVGGLGGLFEAIRMRGGRSILMEHTVHPGPRYSSTRVPPSMPPFHSNSLSLWQRVELRPFGRAQGG
jgi:hypothetical protein